MKRNSITSLLICVLATAALASSTAQESIPNPRIDYKGFLEDASKVEELRAKRRVSESAFIAMSQDPTTVVLDLRSEEKYRLLHVKGAKNLSLPDVTEGELARLIPDKTARILIYCNNNFENEPVAFTSKMTTASLNIYSFNTLYSYGYRNIYELGPLLDIRETKIPFEGKIAQELGK